jgi:hypothetical protein
MAALAAAGPRQRACRAGCAWSVRPVPAQVGYRLSQLHRFAHDRLQFRFDLTPQPASALGEEQKAGYRAGQGAQQRAAGDRLSISLGGSTLTYSSGASQPQRSPKLHRFRV